ncbi:hypothetical protein [Lentzea flaviverrucosa]|uniref:hypothetical protein n=1 Tax=Lentzea flaviverrucosa TaxID=200379 RepID=UPI003CCC8007
MVHLREHDPTDVPAYHCFEPYCESARNYAMATRLVPADCENEVVDLLVRLRERAAAPAAALRHRFQCGGVGAQHPRRGRPPQPWRCPAGSTSASSPANATATTRWR